MRRALIGRIARKELKDNARLLEDDRVVNYIDFRERISLEKLKSLSERSFSRVSLYKSGDVENRFGLSGHAKTSGRENLRASLI